MFSGKSRHTNVGDGKVRIITNSELLSISVLRL